jgi:ATP-dependent Zn protease
MMPVTKWDIYATELDTWVRGIMVSLAGHVAVELVQGKAWTGAGSDFKNIKAYLSALAQHGFFDTLPTGLNPLEHKTTESKTQKFLKKCVKKTKDLLEEHRAELDALWEALIEKEDLPGSEAVRIIEDAQQVSV